MISEPASKKNHLNSAKVQDVSLKITCSLFCKPCIKDLNKE
jgi:hypothetical protein